MVHHPANFPFSAENHRLLFEPRPLSCHLCLPLRFKGNSNVFPPKSFRNSLFLIGCHPSGKPSLFVSSSKSLFVTKLSLISQGKSAGAMISFGKCASTILTMTSSAPSLLSKYQTRSVSKSSTILLSTVMRSIDIFLPKTGFLFATSRPRISIGASNLPFDPETFFLFKHSRFSILVSTYPP